ncbi:MAG: hypothetical protein A2033_00345 [Bacteroidetes bacterium GWA2_31_9]|nr:MAG: hypothetical protein A2033_00345 [Bacteroidetes bacterium GWA2_31_9]
MKVQVFEKAYFKSPIGLLELRGSSKGISKIIFLNESDVSDVDFDVVPECLQDCVNQFKEFFAGKRKEFNLLLDYKGSAFQCKVWKKILDIPYGKVLTYSELSEIVRNLDSIRAVASANSKNPIPIIIPCHRVVGVNHKLVGYLGGIWRKEWLLNFESGITQTTLF